MIRIMINNKIKFVQSYVKVLLIDPNSIVKTEHAWTDKGNVINNYLDECNGGNTYLAWTI